jgi:hypothetical protein
LAIVRFTAVWVEQADLGGRNLIKQTLCQPDMRAGLECPEIRHLSVGCVLDNFWICFESSNPQEPIVIGGLLGKWNSQPDSIGIERIVHRWGSENRDQ